MSDKDRTKALEVAISQIEKQFGKGAIMRLGAEGVVERRGAAEKWGPKEAQCQAVTGPTGVIGD